MMINIKKQKKTEKIIASKVDDVLILSCVNAVQPIVWRMEIDKIGTASFEVDIDAQTGHTSLVMKQKTGKAEKIAVFKTKEEAVEALMAASDAMQSISIPSPAMQAKVSTPQKMIVKGQQKSGLKWGWLALAFVVVVLLYIYLTTLMPQTMELPTNAQNSLSDQTPPQQRTGVPMSADDYLQGF